MSAGPYRSSLERAVAAQLGRKGVPFDYEPFAIPYTQPAKRRRYTPDYVLGNGVIIETKGQFTTADRQKHLMVRDSWPGLDIRFVFSRSSTRISKRSKTTYAAWCRTHGFQYHDKVIPASWWKEPQNADSLAAIAAIISGGMPTNE